MKLNILQEIAQRTKERIETQKKVLPLDKIIEIVNSDAANDSPFTFPFEKALKSEDIAFICEIKKASPSKGIIAEKFPYLDIAKEYEAAGAAAISVLTEPFYFMGSDQYLREIADVVSIPLLRKDFTVDSYMIYEAKLLGASAVLLICSILNQDTLADYITIAHGLGLSALVETHSEEEVKMALSAGARIIGVNNRNLKTFTVDITLSERLRSLVPPDVLFVSESGLSTQGDIVKLRETGADAALIGETLMRAADKKAVLASMKFAGGGKVERKTFSTPERSSGFDY
ncbi:MAG: indole-3-glycerol phosphate synthase TrpC [Lachnospiraceae bacterium]|nr:indole-3-glycerol phosphate synthase TrpC [Lachnospiraceae bacterium]